VLAGISFTKYKLGLLRCICSC